MQRALLASLVFVIACGPKVAPKTTAFDEDLPAEKTISTTEVAPAPPPRPEAPPGKGLRSGTIDRAQLLAVLDKGPGMFLRQLEISARMEGSRFVGWRFVQLLDPKSPLRDV